MNSVSNIFIKQVSAQLTSTSSGSYSGARERDWGQRVLNFGSGGSTITSVLVSTINFVLGIAIVVIAIYLVNGALMYITSAGNKDKAKEAYTTIKNALIALVGIITLGSLLSILNTMIR